MKFPEIRRGPFGLTVMTVGSSISPPPELQLGSSVRWRSMTVYDRPERSYRAPLQVQIAMHSPLPDSPMRLSVASLGPPAIILRFSWKGIKVLLNKISPQAEETLRSRSNSRNCSFAEG